MKKYFLSIYFGYHDSCITISDQKKILLHLEAERIFRKKHLGITSTTKMEKLIKIGLNYLKLDIKNVSTLYVADWNNQYKKTNVKILGKSFNVILTSHHQNHIGTSYPAGFNDSIIVCADGGSEDGSTKIYLNKNSKIKLIDDLDNTPATGKFFGTLTQMIVADDFERAHHSYPGKTMGLAGTGEESLIFKELIEKNWQEINKLQFKGVDHLLNTFKISLKNPQFWQDKKRRDLAYTGQKYWVDYFFNKLKKYAKLSSNISIVGGCALNVILNSRIRESGLFNHVYVSPISGDSGQSLGAILFHNPNIKASYPFLGRGFGEINEIPEEFLDDLFDNKIVAWYQGRSEIGARALGHRSFLGLPSTLKLKVQLNEVIKGRESFRPVAPMIAFDYVENFFYTNKSSEYMTFSVKAKEITKKLAPAIVHQDGTSRIQTVSENDNPIIFKALIETMKKTGAPILMNTSFNVDGEPIVDTPEDAKKTFKKSRADSLFINGKRYIKNY